MCELCGDYVLYNGIKVIIYGSEILICQRCKAKSAHHVLVICPECKSFKWVNHDWNGSEDFAFAGMKCERC